jgi:hypothetical protein
VQIAPPQPVFRATEADHDQVRLKSKIKRALDLFCEAPMVRGDEYEAVLRHTSTFVAAPLPVAANA